MASSAFASEECVTISSEKLIFAPYDVAFETTADVASYPQWNPYITAVIPDTADITNVGETFVLQVIGPVSGDVTFAPEVVTGGVTPDQDPHFAQIRYAFDDPFAALLGFPERNQDFTNLFGVATYYETSETFCGPLVPLLPLDDVQAGFDAQAEALAHEAFSRWLDDIFNCFGW
jgi:hypothetical protein